MNLINRKRKSFKVEKEKLLEISKRNLTKWKNYKTCVESASNFRELHSCMKYRR
jgi:hypothetical protein